MVGNTKTDFAEFVKCLVRFSDKLNQKFSTINLRMLSSPQADNQKYKYCALFWTELFVSGWFSESHVLLAVLCFRTAQ